MGNGMNEKAIVEVKFKGIVRMPHLRIPKGTRIDYKYNLVKMHGDGYESILLTKDELEEVGKKTIEELIEEKKDVPIITHDSEFGDVKTKRGSKYRHWYTYLECTAKGTRVNSDGEIVRYDENGREEVLLSHDELLESNGRTLNMMIAEKNAKAKEQGAMA